MAAEDHLSVGQFHPKEIGFLESRDYPGKLKELKFRPGGESDQRVKEIMESAKTEGIREPIRVEGYLNAGRAYLADGHHRYMAAKRLNIPIPVTGMGATPAPREPDPLEETMRKREEIRKKAGLK